MNPLLGLVGGMVEGFVTILGVKDAGVRAMATSRLLGTSVGADWDVRDKRPFTIVSWQTSIRRGRLLGAGSMLLDDWIPERTQTVWVGISAPLSDPLAGRPHPAATTVEIPRPLQPKTPVAESHDARSLQLSRELQSTSELIVAYSDLYTNGAIQRSRPAGYRAAMNRSRTALEELSVLALNSAERFARPGWRKVWTWAL